MMATDRFNGFFRNQFSTLRGISILFGINLILAGLIIFFFPEVLVFMIALTFVAGGAGLIASALRPNRREYRQYTIWE